MAKFKKGDIVLAPFPYSQWESTDDEKVRPQIVILQMQVQTTGGGVQNDYVVCPLTTRDIRDPNAIPVHSGDYADGVPTNGSRVRPLYLYGTAEQAIIRRIGSIKSPKMKSIIDCIVTCVRPD
jgi:mRNA-degrading endonuclease toxin of MazEF toxin-antitoxin module